MASISDDRAEKYLEKMRVCIKSNNIKKAVRYAEASLEIRYSDKLLKRIGKMKIFLSQLEDENDDMEDVGQGLILPKSIVAKLYGYQKTGLLWMWDLHRRNKGGVLGDDMGLGKTVQLTVFLASMFNMREISSALIVMPVSLIANWMAEFEKWAGEVNVHDYHGATKRQREIILTTVQRKGGVVIITYGILVQGAKLLSDAFVWDYMILDEGHKIKNPTKCTKGAHSIPSRHRMVLTGTPIQNNLVELWALFDFTHMGGLLGTLRTFKMEFEGPIKRSREKGASTGESILGKEMAVVLRKKIEPYFLRRTKAEVLSENKENQGTGDGLRPAALERKNDFVVWICLSQSQLKLYRDFLNMDAVKEVLMTSRSPLVEINVLKKICDHPRLLKAEACSALGLDSSQTACVETGVNYDHVSDEVLLQESGKMMFLLRLLDNLTANGHRSLVFSQSLRILDIAQRILNKRGIRSLRIDGAIKSSHERQAIIEKFSRNKKYAVFLLTSQVGGVGLTITAADRVIIYDPSWNPATDSQAIDRCYRIGQEKKVVVYRLITCATVEEKIYRRQVFKQSLHKQTTEGNVNPFRYFRNQELYELFTLGDTSTSTTQIQLNSMHATHRKTDTQLDKHIAELYSLGIFGISDHDLLFSIEENDDEVDDTAQQFVAAKVKKAETLVAMECEVNNLAIQDGKFVKPNLASESSSSTSSSTTNLRELKSTVNYREPSPDRYSEESSKSDSEESNISEESRNSVQLFIDGSGSVIVEETPDVTPVQNLSRDTNVIVISDSELDEEKENDDQESSKMSVAGSSPIVTGTILQQALHGNRSQSTPLSKPPVASKKRSGVSFADDRGSNSIDRSFAEMNISGIPSHNPNAPIDYNSPFERSGGSPSALESFKTVSAGRKYDRNIEDARKSRRYSLLVKLQSQFITNEDNEQDETSNPKSQSDLSNYKSLSSHQESEVSPVTVKRRPGKRYVIESDSE